jgi:uncharacterized protein YicC (UPF0701 family)
MTGFARRETQGPWGTVLCELRTVNHRYLEVGLRLPDEFRALETEARQLMASALRRGKVDASVHFRPAATTAASLQLNETALAEVLARLEDISAQIQGAKGQAQARSAVNSSALTGTPAGLPLSKTTVNLMDVLRWPGVVREGERDLSPAFVAVTELIRGSLAELNDSRAREGARIRELILQRCAAIQAQVGAIRSRLPEISGRLRTRLMERLGQLAATMDNERLQQEMVLYAHKLDVDEELDRLQSHLTEVTSVLDSSEPAGRRLDFLMQELNREANTLSSKSQDVETTRAAVDMKVSIEQMREQIQNIE